MQPEQLEKLKGLLLEYLLVDSDMRGITYKNNSTAKGIRKLIRDSTGAKDRPKIVIVKNNTDEPVLKGEKSYWFIDRKWYDTILQTKEQLRFKRRPYGQYHQSDYMITVGEQWLTNVLQNKGN